MKPFSIYSWNVNGIRATQKKGFLQWLEKVKPDVVFLQETKAEKTQLDPEILAPKGYHTFWHSSQRKKGYSGTALYTKILPERISSGIGNRQFDSEGRTIVAEFGDITMFGVYFPNGKASQERLDFKLSFYEEFRHRVMEELKKGKKVLVCGDVNTAHHPIDLARPEENEDISGFLPIERDWMNRFEEEGFHDTFRMYHPNEPNQYTWWSMRSGARSRNVGWRIDYFHVSTNLKSQVKAASIHPEVMGSDHCPISIDLEMPLKVVSNAVCDDPEGLAGTTMGVQETLI
jgi:exodeoxyribonuclease-3